MSYLDKIDKNGVPRHVAIIMDGNGRWANARGMERVAGHRQGAQQVHTIMEDAVRLGVEYLTLYTFSTENWNRPQAEINALMEILLEHINEETFMKNNVRFRVIGQVDRLPVVVQEAVKALAELTKNNTKSCMVIALSYSSKWELTKVAHDIAVDVKEGKLSSDNITEETINQYLATSFMPEPELLIRTGGEKRLSNFLLWQSAYSEFYFTDTYWPDFSSEDFYKAICDYQSRQRRFGKTEEQVENESNKSK
ncbi:MAG: isoprenyl transferase [Bacteroidales bacterium]|nr:isoprenyl transferase [Bacteroidales bacterium]